MVRQLSFKVLLDDVFEVKRNATLLPRKTLSAQAGQLIDEFQSHPRPSSGWLLSWMTSLKKIDFDYACAVSDCDSSAIQNWFNRERARLGRAADGDPTFNTDLSTHFLAKGGETRALKDGLDKIFSRFAQELSARNAGLLRRIQISRLLAVPLGAVEGALFLATVGSVVLNAKHWAAVWPAALNTPLFPISFIALVGSLFSFVGRLSRQAPDTSLELLEIWWGGIRDLTLRVMLALAFGWIVLRLPHAAWTEWWTQPLACLGAFVAGLTPAVVVGNIATAFEWMSALMRPGQKSGAVPAIVPGEDNR